MIFPPFLSPGDKIRVVAPSGPFDSDQLRTGLGTLSSFLVETDPEMWHRQDGFLAGTDDVRLAELQEALDCSTTSAILIARGGYGLTRLLPQLDFELFARRPKWLLGFSDATALHQLFNKRGYVSMHSANGTTLGRLNQIDLNATLNLLAGQPSQPFENLDCISPGKATGQIWGGNLTVLFTLAAAGQLEIPAGVLLFLEDVSETSYRVDRMLTALRQGGHFSGVRGILLGQFAHCSSGKFDVPTSEVLVQCLEGLGVPVVSNLPVGHGSRNSPLLLGHEWTLDARLGRASPQPFETISS